MEKIFLDAFNGNCVATASVELNFPEAQEPMDIEADQELLDIIDAEIDFLPKVTLKPFWRQ